MICWNLECISHDFIYNPFSTSRWLNRAVGVLETITLGIPHQLALIDFSDLNDTQTEKKGKKLEAKAEARGWLYLASLDI